MSSGQRLTSLLRRDHPAGELRLPLVELRGKGSGPILALIAGCHGAEYAGIEAAVRLGRHIDTRSLRGIVRIVTIANLPGFLGRSEAVCPIDGHNPNRVFPGDPAGGYTEALAAMLFSEVISGSSAVVDMHGGDIFERLVPYTGVSACPDPSVYKASLEMARAYQPPLILDSTRARRPGTVAGGTTLATAARNAGIPAILAEAGGEGILSEREVALHRRGVLNVMYHLGMCADRPEQEPGTPQLLTTDFWRVDRDGLVYPELSVGQRIRAGERIGMLTDWFGDQATVLTAPHDATVVAVVTTPAARSGAVLYQVAME